LGPVQPGSWVPKHALVRGNLALIDQDRQVVDPGLRTIALCGCGHSAVKPVCDGTHELGGYAGAGGW
jgi:CDGSH-type Zn-finger protein